MARIMVTWVIISGAQAFVVGEISLNIVRLLLGVAEASVNLNQGGTKEDAIVAESKEFEELDE